MDRFEPRAEPSKFDERWVDEEAGPIVRSYAIARGRTQPRGVSLDLVTLLQYTGHEPPRDFRMTREDQRMIALCRRPCTVADLASDLDLPLGVVKVLAADLCHNGLLEIRRPGRPMQHADQQLLQRVLDDLRAL
ncbi:DUF742 domain-containing protein [Actinocorallia longicatena]|uniref:DUF742 domain-containing protein n=1 Tax=Actinocorallia longicatena TaxID=111803 RepID=A0ABP6PYI6_9ACTN